MKKNAFSKIVGLILLAAFVVALASCGNANQKIVDAYKALGKELLAAAQAGDMAKVAELTPKLEEIGKQLEKAKLTDAQKKDLAEFGASMLQGMMAPPAPANP